MQNSLIEKLRFLEDVPRHKALFLLLLRSEDYITSEALAKNLEVTSRTIKSDVAFISENFKCTPIKIETKQSRGIRVSIDDEDLKNEVKEYFKIYSIDNIDSDFKKRVRYIVRRLLTSEEPIRIETLQDELYINTSNYINKELSSVRKILDNYDLTLHSIKKRGLMIKGEGFNRLLCLVKMCKFFDKSADSKYTVPEFTALFEPEFADKQTIKQVICECLSQTRIVFSDIYLERFVLFFILLNKKRVSRKDLTRSIFKMDFKYQLTDEYKLMQMIDHEMKRYEAYQFGNEILIQFMTYMAIMSTDLYRFRDCNEEKYGSLIALSEKIRYLILSEFEHQFKVYASDDATLLKDLIKVIIPIAMKIKLGISDDVDLGFYNPQYNKPVIASFIDQIALCIKDQYHYELSLRERHLLLSVIYEFINAIELSYKKMRIALIAIDGRISTQQIKICMRKNYSSFIEKISTFVLYELDKQQLDYDCYFCLSFGKHMNIPYKPIYFFDEGASDEVYNRMLESIFLSSYDYNLVLPYIKYSKINKFYKIKAFPIHNYLQENSSYMKLLAGKKQNIDIRICFDAIEEMIEIFYFDNDEMDIDGIKYYIIINLNINYNRQKFKMILNLISSIADNPEYLKTYCKDSITDINEFFRRK